jgi:hypothetical protein
MANSYRNALLAAGADAATVDKFFAYHTENPKIWELFERHALRQIEQGYFRLSSKAIFEDVRRDPELIKNGESVFKCSNSFTAYYGRIFAVKYPQFADRFLFKPLTGLHSEPVQMGQQILFRRSA